MKRFLVCCCLPLVLALSIKAQPPAPADSAATGTNVETLICIRHGEKPPGGLGQLNCRGLNRSLALPDVLLNKFGKPRFIFAPNPTQKNDLDQYYYVRPLATIEPTAIRCGLPVNTEFGYLETKDLEKELDKDKYHQATVFIAWEHVLLAHFARQELKDHGGHEASVPSWPGKDYDTIYVIKITRAHGQTTTDFSTDQEGLNNVSDNCP